MSHIKYFKFQKTYLNLQNILKIHYHAKQFSYCRISNKKRKLYKVLGKDFVVESSIGHIRDLPKKGGMAIDIDNGFKPTYEVSKRQRKSCQTTKKYSKKG